MEKLQLFLYKKPLALILLSQNLSHAQSVTLHNVNIGLAFFFPSKIAPSETNPHCLKTIISHSCIRLLHVIRRVYFPMDDRAICLPEDKNFGLTPLGQTAV